METVRLPEPAELGPEDQKIFENTRQWFRIDFVPKMSRVLRAVPAVGDAITRASRRAMPDRVLSRAQKELIAAAVSAMTRFDFAGSRSVSSSPRTVRLIRHDRP